MTQTEPAFDYGAHIRTLRERLGLTQAQLATAVGTTQQTVDRIERGQTSFSRFMKPIDDFLAQAWESDFARRTSPDAALPEAPTVPIYFWNSETDAVEDAGRVTAPPPLAKSRDGYAILLNTAVRGPWGDAVFLPGDTLFADPDATVRHYVWVIASDESKPGLMVPTIYIDPAQMPPSYTREEMDRTGYAVKGDKGRRAHKIVAHYTV